jgi:hypothetical protein
MWTLEDIKTFFELAGCVEDYCETHYEDKVVCGGWNRMYLYPDGTVKISVTHSNHNFINLAREFKVPLIY